MPRKKKERITDVDDAPPKRLTTADIAADVAAFLAKGGAVSTPRSPVLRAVRRTRDSRFRYVIVKDDPVG
jgi:hypothetical protein